MLGFSCILMAMWEEFLACAFLSLDVYLPLTRVCGVFIVGLSSSVPIL